MKYGVLILDVQRRMEVIYRRAHVHAGDATLRRTNEKLRTEGKEITSGHLESKAY